MAEDYYSVLGLQRNASPSEIKKQYYKLARQYHPDRTKNDPESVRTEKTEKFKAIQNAYSILTEGQGEAFATNVDANKNSNAAYKDQNDAPKDRNDAPAPKDKEYYKNLDNFITAIRESDLEKINDFMTYYGMYSGGQPIDIDTLNKGIKISREIESRYDVKQYKNKVYFDITYELESERSREYQYNRFTGRYFSSLIYQAIKIRNKKTEPDFMGFAEKIKNYGRSAILLSQGIYFNALGEETPKKYSEKAYIAESSNFSRIVNFGDTAHLINNVLQSTIIFVITLPVIVVGACMIATGSLLSGIGSLAGYLFSNKSTNSIPSFVSPTGNSEKSTPKNTIPTESLKALSKLSPELPKLLVKHFAERAEEISKFLKIATAKNDTSAIAGLTEDINQLELDWKSIMDNVNDPKAFCSAVQQHLDRKQYDFSKEKSYFGFRDSKTKAAPKEQENVTQLRAIINNIRMSH